MKTIVETSTGLSKYIFENSVELNINSDNTVTPNFIIGDMNSSNSTLHEGVTPPEDWTGNKYTFNGTTWTLNPDWVEPEPDEEESE